MTAGVERERTWLVRRLPELPPGTPIRQGYLAQDGSVSVRVHREGDDRVVTVEGGAGRSRSEVGWAVSPAQFEALWALSDGRRVHKVRHELALDGAVAEVDVFEGPLQGLVLVEVEFDDDVAMASFEPPDWFGPEVSDRPEYTDASLACRGIPPGHPHLPAAP